MAASGYSIAAIAEIEAGKSIDNVIKNLSGVKLREASVVIIYLTRGAVGVLVTVTVGGSVVLPSAPVNLVTVNGTLPSTQDDEIIVVMAQASDEIIIAGTNADAATQELRALVQVLPIDDAILLHAAKIRTGQ